MRKRKVLRQTRPVERPSRERLVRRYIEDDRTAYEMAEKWGVSLRTMVGWLEDEELLRSGEFVAYPCYRKRPGRPIVSRFRELARVETVSQLARRYAVTRQTIYNWLEREGLSAVDGNRSAAPSLAELEGHRDAGLSYGEIGALYGVSRQRVYQWLTRDSGAA